MLWARKRRGKNAEKKQKRRKERAGEKRKASWMKEEKGLKKIDIITDSFLFAQLTTPFRLGVLRRKKWRISQLEFFSSRLSVARLSLFFATNIIIMQAHYRVSRCTRVLCAPGRYLSNYYCICTNLSLNFADTHTWRANSLTNIVSGEKGREKESKGEKWREKRREAGRHQLRWRRTFDTLTSSSPYDSHRTLMARLNPISSWVFVLTFVCICIN